MQLISQSRVLLETFRGTLPRLIMNFLAFYAIGWFSVVTTKACHKIQQWEK